MPVCSILIFLIVVTIYGVTYVLLVSLNKGINDVDTAMEVLNKYRLDVCIHFRTEFRFRDRSRQAFHNLIRTLDLQIENVFILV